MVNNYIENNSKMFIYKLYKKLKKTMMNVLKKLTIVVN